MTSPKFEIIGLVGFIVSGLCFTVSGIVNGDPWAVTGSLVWIAACVVWLYPIVRR